MFVRRGIFSFQPLVRRAEALGNAGAASKLTHRYQDLYNKHRQVVQFSFSRKPTIATDAFVAPSATLAGHIQVWPKSSIWYDCVLRADFNAIKIGTYTNIQDRTIILEASKPLSEAHDGTTVIGHYVTVGHGCVLRACTIEDKCLVGMGSILDEGSYMETESMLAAGSILEKGVRISTGELWGGTPAKFMRKLSEHEMHSFQEIAENYAITAEMHREEFDLPVGTAWSDADKKGIQTGFQRDVLD